MRVLTRGEGAAQAVENAPVAYLTVKAVTALQMNRIERMKLGQTGSLGQSYASVVLSEV
jgi:hypothetical protein